MSGHISTSLSVHALLCLCVCWAIVVGVVEPFPVMCHFHFSVLVNTSRLYHRLFYRLNVDEIILKYCRRVFKENKKHHHTCGQGLFKFHIIQTVKEAKHVSTTTLSSDCLFVCLLHTMRDLKFQLDEFSLR